MNYKRVYDSIIENRKRNPVPKGQYSEKHHIVPRCLGGKDNKDNLVVLTAKEHFICHMLLVEIYRHDKKNYYKMLHAFIMMKAQNKSHGNNRYINSRLYAKYRKEFVLKQSKTQSGKLNSQYGSCWIYNLNSKQTKKIPKHDLDQWLAEGWIKGRFYKRAYDKYKRLLLIYNKSNSIGDFCKKANITKTQYYKCINYFNNSNFKYKSFECKCVLSLEEYEYKYWWDLYLNSEYKSLRQFVKHTHYYLTPQTLSTKFKKYIREYNPINRTKFKK